MIYQRQISSAEGTTRLISECARAKWAIFQLSVANAEITARRTTHALALLAHVYIHIIGGGRAGGDKASDLGVIRVFENNFPKISSPLARFALFDGAKTRE